VLLEEAAYSVRDYLGKLEADPKRLEDVETRLAALDRLKRKYGGSLTNVLAFRADVAQRADEVENAAEHRVALEKELSAAAAEYEQIAAQLMSKRSDGARLLARAVEEELKSLAMQRTRFVIDLKPGPWTAHGSDVIVFLVSPNSGEEPKPLDRVASGGELSRIALALKTAAQKAGDSASLHTLVFDEVDAGIGGAAAAAVGKRLKILSRTNQVICVTHLAQIAGFADHQYAVSKEENAGRVATRIVELDPAGRAHEIGRMLSGDRVTPEALKQAEQLMQAGKR
jgi:DNA repair protein RecN (Recombination protein N)